MYIDGCTWPQKLTKINRAKRSWIKSVKHPKHLLLFCYYNSKTRIGGHVKLPVLEIRLILKGDACELNSTFCCFTVSVDDKMFSPFAISLVDSTF